MISLVPSESWGFLKGGLVPFEFGAAGRGKSVSAETPQLCGCGLRLGSLGVWGHALPRAFGRQGTASPQTRQMRCWPPPTEVIKAPYQESLRLLGNNGLRRGIFHLRQRNKMFLLLALRNFSPFTQCFFGVPAWGGYHYPRRALHAVETLDARRSRRLICRFYAVPEFALCGQNIPAAGTHATPAPNRAHSGSHAETRGVSPPETSAGSIGSTAWVP